MRFDDDISDLPETGSPYAAQAAKNKQKVEAGSKFVSAFDLTAQVDSLPAEGPVQPGTKPLLMHVTHLGLKVPGFGIANMRDCDVPAPKLELKPCPGEERINLDHGPYCGTLEGKVCDKGTGDILSVWAGFIAGDDIAECTH